MFRKSRIFQNPFHRVSPLFYKIILIIDTINFVLLLQSKRVEIENEGNRLEEQKFDLNPDHSHFLIVKDGTISKTGINYFLLKLQQYLATTLDHPRKLSASYRKILQKFWFIK